MVGREGSQSVLYEYARRLDPTKLIDIASSEAFVKPGGDVVNEILLGFTRFHLNNNKQNLTALKRSIEKMSDDYGTLKKNVQEMVRIREHFYNSKDGKLPNIGGSASSSIARGGDGGLAPQILNSTVT